MNALILTQIQDLTEQQKGYVVNKLTANSKQVSTAYLLWFIFGAHYFYLGKPLLNILYWITLCGFGIWGIIDLFRMKGLVEDVNAKEVSNYIEEAKVLFKEK